MRRRWIIVALVLATAACGSDSSTGNTTPSRTKTSGTVRGTVVSWEDEQGFGVLAAPDVDGEVWAHFSAIRGEGFRRLTPGERVEFRLETPGQDGYPHRAIWVRSLTGAPPST